MVHIFLSPHLDDVIISCGGTIAKLAESPENQITIFNLFSGEAILPFSPFAQKLHKQWGNPKDIIKLRRAEDQAAVAKLGVFSQYESIPDSLYRQTKKGDWMYDRKSLWKTPKSEDNWIPHYLLGKIEKNVSYSKKICIYAPLSIGNHVDHQIAFNVGKLLLQNGYNVMFYEDLPYAIKQKNAPLNVICSIVAFNEKCLHAKLESIMCYRSQISTIFGSKQKMYEMIIGYSQQNKIGNDLFGEKYWRFK